MASTLPIRAARTAAGHSFANPAPAASLLPRRVFSTTPAAFNAAEDHQPAQQNGEQKLPRWAYTPPRAKAPFSLKLDSKRPEFHINNSPERLDQFYIGMLGEGGDKVLPEELKWLAVTHKSFDQGRRGFNDRLAFLGKRIVELQASLGLAQDNPKTRLSDVRKDQFGRKPFVHPALEGLSNLSDNTKRDYLDRLRLAELAKSYGLPQVMRWSPRMPDKLRNSGLHVVLAHTMYAIVGAVALEKGGMDANKVAQKRILVPLGMKIA